MDETEKASDMRCLFQLSEESRYRFSYGTGSWMMNEFIERNKLIVYNIKKALNTCIRICAVCCGVFLIIHCRAIAACLTGVEMPEAPEWHRKCFECE